MSWNSSSSHGGSSSSCSLGDIILGEYAGDRIYAGDAGDAGDPPYDGDPGAYEGDPGGLRLGDVTLKRLSIGTFSKASLKFLLVRRLRILPVLTLVGVIRGLRRTLTLDAAKGDTYELYTGTTLRHTGHPYIPPYAITSLPLGLLLYVLSCIR